MKEIVHVNLENEMDLILAHKRAMKLCELTGFSLIVQTSIATAVSEIARCAIDFGKNAVLILGIETLGEKKILKALIRDTTDFSSRCSDACAYAKRLVDDVEIIRSPKQIEIIMKQQVNFPGTLTTQKIESFLQYFSTEPPISPYDELRRKNIQLLELVEKVKESENDYRSITDSLPLMMFSVNPRGGITFTNKWLQDFLGGMPKEIGSTSWQNYLHPEDYSPFMKDINMSNHRQIPLSGQYRFREKSSGNFLWHMFSIIPLKNDKEVVMRWQGFIVDIHAQKRIEQTLKDNRELKESQEQLFQNQMELRQKVIELNRSNHELEQFAHLASHDLQEPLRKLFYYSDVLQKKYSDILDTSGTGILKSMTASVHRMKELIRDLLTYSQLQHQKLPFETVDLSDIMTDIIKEFDLTIKEKGAVIAIDPFPQVMGNPIRLRQLFSNLISNALKYSRKEVLPEITVQVSNEDDHVSIKVRDNGIGFEEEYAERIFGLFERLHSRDEFPGTGIGLAICKRIVELHHGKISAVSKPNEYSVFEINLPVRQEENVLVE